MHAKRQYRAVRRLAPESISRDMFVTVVSVVHRSSFVADGELGSNAAARLATWWVPPLDPEAVLKVRAVALPIVVAVRPDGSVRTLDVRVHRIGRFEEEYGKEVWEMLRTPALKR